MIREEKVAKLIEIAKAQMGKPYSYGAYTIKDGDENPESFDCSSFTQFCLKRISFDDFPRSSIEQAAYQGEEISIGFLQPGDLVFCRGSRGHYNDELFPNRKICIGHVAICSYDGKIIHAAGGKGVVEEGFSEAFKRGVTIMKRYF